MQYKLGAQSCWRNSRKLSTWKKFTCLQNSDFHFKLSESSGKFTNTD